MQLYPKPFFMLYDYFVEFNKSSAYWGSQWFFNKLFKHGDMKNPTDIETSNREMNKKNVNFSKKNSETNCKVNGKIVVIRIIVKKSQLLIFC